MPRALTDDVVESCEKASRAAASAIHHADRLVTSAYGRGRSLDRRVIDEVKQQFYHFANMAADNFYDLHDKVCHCEVPDDASERRKAIRVIRARAACSYHRARETYDALSAAGLL